MCLSLSLPLSLCLVLSLLLSLSPSEGKTPALESKNGKKVERAGGGGSKPSMLTWMVVLALLGVWSSMAVLYFDIVDYDSVIGN